MTSAPLKIGITGGIGSGKSIISTIFSILGIAVYNADSRAKNLMATDPEIKEKIVDLFGSDSFDGDDLNRTHIGKIAFYQPDKLSKLNQIVHPAVGNDFNQWASRQEGPYILKEAALLFEAGSYKDLDHVITVTCPEDLRIKRVLERDRHRSEEDVRKIIDKQWTDQKKKELSDFLIENDESRSVIKQVLHIHQRLLS